MNDDSLRAAYAQLLDERGGRAAECVTPEALLAVVDGSAREADRLRTLRHVGGCRDCRADLELLRTARDVAERVARPAWRGPLLAAAASMLLVVGGVALWQALLPAETMRGAATSVQLLAPAEDAGATVPVTLIWAAVPGARRYDVEILNADGAAVYATMTADTALDVPEAAALAPGGDYRWWVRALLADGTQPRSTTRRLRIVTP